jgi:hypothetical protein
VPYVLGFSPADTPLPHNNYKAAGTNIGNARVWWANHKDPDPAKELEDKTDMNSGEIQCGSNITGTDLCVNKPPTTSLFCKGHQDAYRTLEKMC